MKHQKLTDKEMMNIVRAVHAVDSCKACQYDKVYQVSSCNAVVQMLSVVLITERRVKEAQK